MSSIFKNNIYFNNSKPFKPMIYQMHENLKGRDNQLKSPPPKKNITIYFAYPHVSNFYSEKTEIYISCLF